MSIRRGRILKRTRVGHEVPVVVRSQTMSVLSVCCSENISYIQLYSVNPRVNKHDHVCMMKNKSETEGAEVSFSSVFVSVAYA